MGAIYSDTKRAQTLAILVSNGGNIAATSRDADVPETTVRHWRDGEIKRLETPEAAELGAQKVEELDELWDRFARKTLGFALGDMGELKLNDATWSQIATAAGIATDKRALLRGQPTNITESVGDAERKARLQAVADRVASELLGSGH